MLKNAKVGQKVYAIWGEFCVSAEVTEIIEDTKTHEVIGYRWKGGQHLDFTTCEERDDYFGGTAGSTVENTFLTAAEAVAEFKRRDEEAYNRYCKELNGVGDFIRFALNHCVACGEDTDWEARHAFIKRAEDVFGIQGLGDC